MKENDDHKENIDEIIYELSETREDERNSQNQILQTFATAAAILALILGASIFEGDTIIQKPYAIRLSIYLLSVMILTATISYIISLDITNVLRFHYIKQLENKLSSIEKNNLDLPHWISFNTAINTRNIKHIFRSPYTVVSFCFYFLAIVFLILFCFGLVIGQHDFLKLNRNSLIIIPFSFIFISLFAFVLITTKSKNMYHFSCMFSNKRQQESVTGNEIGDFELTNGKNIFLKGLSYFIYPKAKDFQKALFVLIGYVLGVVLTYNYSDFLSVFYENLGQAFLVFFIIEVLIYQARYQFNDIRGLYEDIETYKITKRSNKFLVLTSNRKRTVVFSLFIIFIKIVLAFSLALRLGGLMIKPLIWCICLIILTTILYEIARTMKCDIAILVLVTTGYPIRFLAGLWCAIPDLFNNNTLLNRLTISPSQVVFYLLAIAAMGGFSVMIPWIYEAFHQKKIASRIIKHHYVFLFNSFEERYNQYITKRHRGFFPLLEKGKLTDCWNLCFSISILFLSAILLLRCFDWYILLVESISLLLIIKLCLSSYKKIASTLIQLSILIIIKCILISLLFNGIERYISIGIYAHQLLFSLLYSWFRCCFDPSFNFFKFMFSCLIGLDTARILNSENEVKKQTNQLDSEE